MRLFQITTRLAQKGFEVHIYTMKWWKKGNVPNKGNEVRLENGVYLHAICPLYPLYDGPRRSIKQGILFGLACFRLIKADFDVVDVDHMPFFPLYSMRVVCWMKGKELVATWHEVWGKEYWQKYLPGPKGAIASMIENVSMLLPDRFLCISAHTSEKLIKNFHVSKSKIVHIPCGYDDQEIAKAPISNKKSDVIFVGRLLEHKHVDVLIEAIGILKKEKSNVICRVIGVGPEEKKLKSLVKKLNLDQNVIFHGELSSHLEVFSLMKASKVFVLPSTREGFGIVVLEANACGLPVVTIDAPDNAAKELIESGVMGSITPLDTDDLADHIQNYLNSILEIPLYNDYSLSQIINKLYKAYI
jgi:glycosyltransferase involved in cell wall biosynthesis